ncbi:hypothetical protein PYCC9005_005398 [Savitreella phatthalungensis]
MVSARLLGTLVLGGAGYAAYTTGTDKLVMLDAASDARKVQKKVEGLGDGEETPRRLATPSPSEAPVRKLPAYDVAEPPVYLVPDQPTSLQTHIGYLRRNLNDRLVSADATARAAVDKVVGFEKEVERTVRRVLPSSSPADNAGGSVSRGHADAVAGGATGKLPGNYALAPGEPLLPNALYVAVAGMTGSIMARRRNVLVRLTLPAALFVGSAYWLLPQTTRNVADVIGGVEKQYAPKEFQKAHAQTNKALTDLVKKSQELAQDATHVVDGAVGSSKKAFEDVSGIKLAGR